MNEWISVKDRLPVIPKGEYGISVLVAMYDSQYAEACSSPQAGWIVAERMYGECDDLPAFKNSKLKHDFIERWHGADGEWGPCSDPVLYWMPLPSPPKKN